MAQVTEDDQKRAWLWLTKRWGVVQDRVVSELATYGVEERGRALEEVRQMIQSMAYLAKTEEIASNYMAIWAAIGTLSGAEASSSDYQPGKGRHD